MKRSYYIKDEEAWYWYCGDMQDLVLTKYENQITDAIVKRFEVKKV